MKTASSPPRSMQIIAQAIAAGTHAHAFLTVCDGCRNWVSSIYFVVPGSHVRLCPACADKAGVGPARSTGSGQAKE